MKKQKAKSPRSTKELTTLDQVLKSEGKLEEFEAVAIKEVVAWQITEATRVQRSPSHARATRPEEKS